MDIDDILDKAREIIAESAKVNSAPVLMGLPLDIDTSKDESMSPPTDNQCSVCHSPVKSTIMKDAILDMTKNSELKAVILCPKCLTKLLKHKQKQIEENPDKDPGLMIKFNNF